jgi:hypothetical protein
MLSPLGCPENLQLEPSGIITRSVSSFSIVPSVISPVLFMLRQFMLRIYRRGRDRLKR